MSQNVLIFSKIPKSAIESLNMNSSNDLSFYSNSLYSSIFLVNVRKYISFVSIGL